MKFRKSWLWILATLLIVVLCTAGCALADGATDPHLRQVLKDEQLFRKLGAKGNRDSSIQWDENVLKLTETQAPSLEGNGVYTITWNPPVNTTVVSMRAYLWMREYSDDLTTVYLLEKEGSVDPSFTTAEIVSEGSYSVAVYVTIADENNNETTYFDYQEFAIGDGSSAIQLNRKIAQVVESCTVPGNTWQTALNLHDWLTHNAYYDLGCHYYGADGVLLRGYGVCDSYAKAYLLLCEAAHIPVYRITGWAGESHAWNAIQIDGEWYYVDVTWDDPAGVSEAVSGEEYYEYFCLNEDLMSLDHTKDEGVFPESCMSLDANWTLRNTSEAWSSWGDWNDLGNNYFDDDDLLQQYSRRILEQLETGTADSFTVQCDGFFTVITEEQNGLYYYYCLDASSAAAIRRWTLLGMALSRADLDGRTATVSYDRTDNCFAVEPGSAPTECAHDHLYDSDPIQATETGEFYVWEGMAQHRAYGKRTAYFYICPDCGFRALCGDYEAEYDDDLGLEYHVYENGHSFCSKCGEGCWHFRIHEPEVELQTREKSAEREWITWPEDEDYHVLAYVKSTYKVCPDCQTEVVLSRQIADDEDLEALETLKEEHDFSSGECKCGRWCLHNFTDGVCEICGFTCNHYFGEHSNCVCDICGFVCTHEDHRIRVTSEPIVECEWISAEQHAVLTTVTSYAYCEVCGYSTDPVTEMTSEPEDHVDENSDGTCDICGQRITGEWLWEYSPYGLDDARGTLLITGSGVIQDYDTEGAPWVKLHADTIERIIIDPGIRGIGANAFAGLNHTVRVDFKGHTCPEISEQAFAGTTAICRHYTADNSWPEDGEIQHGDGHTITWVTLPFFDPEAEESSITLWYSKSDGWYTQNNGRTYRMTAAQANELAFRYRRLELEDLPSAADFSLMTENWDGIYSIGFAAGCSGSWTVTIPYNEDSQMWVTNDAHDLILNLNTAKNSLVSLRVEDGTTVVNGDLDRLTMFVTFGESVGSVEITGDVNAMYVEEDTENNTYWGYLKVNGTVYTGRITGEAEVPVTKDGKTVIDFGHIVIAETSEICQEEPIIADGNLNVAVTANSDWSRFYDMDYSYDYAEDTCDVCLMPKPGGPDGTFIKQISPFSIDDVIYGDTNLAIVNYTGEEPLVIPGDTDGAGDKIGLRRLAVENARVKVSCPVDVLNTSGYGNSWYDITIDDQVGDLWFGGENRNSRVYITDSGSVQASFLSRVFRSKMICFGVGGVGDFYSNGQLHVPYFKEGQTITYILPGDDALAEAAGLESGSAMMDLDQLSESDLSEEELGQLGLAGGEKISAVVDMTVSSYVMDENGNAEAGEELHELNRPVQIALAAPADARVVRLHEDDDGLHADELDSEVSGKNDGTILFESDRFSKFVLLDSRTWDYEYEEGERMLRITGTGAVNVNGVAPWLSQGYDIGRVMIDEGITSIGPNVFAGLDGRVRIDFCQETKPEINPDSFGTTNVVCRHTSKDDSWPTDGTIGNVTWAWMPTFNMMAAGTFSGLSYGEEDGWAVTVQSTNDPCTEMSPETAHEVLLECYDLFLHDLPDTDELETVIGDLEGEYWMLNAFWNGDTPETLTLNGNGIACITLPRAILVSSDSVVLNVTDPRADGIHRVEVQEGTLNYTGNIETLVLENTGEGSTGTVSVTGTIGEVAYYGEDTNAPFFGTLTVTGSVQGGLVYGGEVIMSIPGVTDSYPMGSAPGQTFGELKDLAAAVVIDTDATPVVAAELEGMTAPTVDQFTLRYMLGGGNVLMLTPLEGSGLGSEPLYVMIDNYNEQFMDNLTDNIVWGSNTEIFLGMPEGSGTVTLTGKDGKGVKELGTGNWTTAIVKCPVNWLYFQPDPGDYGSINLTIEGRVNNAYLQPNNCNLNITLRNGGSIGNGRWKQLLRDYRNFDSHSAPEGGTLQLVKDSALMVMSWTYAEALGAILPPDTVVGAAAGVDHAMARLTEGSVSELSVAERNALGAVTDGEAHFPVDTSQIISVFDITVNEYTVSDSGEASMGSAVSRLSQPIPVTVTNDSEETDVFVVRLHDEDGTISAVKLEAADANGGKTFESDRFSTYLLVSRNTAATFRTITFHANNADGGEKTQDVVDGVPTALVSNTFTNTGYHFIGWTTEEHIEEWEPEIIYEDGAEVSLTADLDLYAVWEQNENGFSLDVVDITNPDERTWDYGIISGAYTMGNVTIPIEGCIGASNFGVNGCAMVQIRFEPGEGYTFIGWYEAEVKDAYAQTLKPVTLRSKETDCEFEVAEEQEWVKICAVVAKTAFGSSKFTIPSSATVIEENAYEGIGAISIVVPKTCTEIKAGAFRDCLNLRMILLPKDCTIDDTAFDGCSSLVIYAPVGGTTQAWAETHEIPFIAEIRP